MLYVCVAWHFGDLRCRHTERLDNLLCFKIPEARFGLCFGTSACSCIVALKKYPPALNENGVLRALLHLNVTTKNYCRQVELEKKIVVH